jgi:hypothetical protein
MSSTRKIILMYGIVFIVLPMVIVAFAELLLTGVYYLTGSKYFENRLEASHRAGMDMRKVFKGGKKDVSNQKLVRVAVFGGSSAAGYGSPTSFAELIGNNEFSGRNIEVHNYARSGEPFVGFQAEVLKNVMSDYDILLVYAGHNEVWQQIYARARRSNKDVILPNGYRVPYGPTPYIELERRIRRIKSTLHTAEALDFREKGLIALTWTIDRSRLFWLTNKIVSKILAIIPGFDPDRAQEYTPKFYYESDFISLEERKNLVEEYKRTIAEIANNLSTNQTLVLSTVLANNFFPPLAEVGKNLSPAESSKIEVATRKSYEQLVTGNFAALQAGISDLPKSAHKTYLEARLCFGKETTAISSKTNCIAQSIEARRLDKLPFRVVPEINEFIREFKAKNVVVVDPERRMEKDANELSKYFSYFIDFQHPSAKGHFTVADTVLAGIFPEYRSKTTAIVDECGNIDNREGDVTGIIKTDAALQVQQFDINIGWLDIFLSAQPTPYPYNVYRSRALLAKESCQKKVRQ